METTLGGDRLGAGKKEKLYLRDYERSTHDLSYVWRSTMGAGTLVPFMAELSLPGDSFEINLECDILTHPTIGPLFGSYKVQLDVFTIPIRLYNAGLHMNRLNIGMKMNEVYLPQVKLQANNPLDEDDLDNCQINSSCIFSYLDQRGLGIMTTASDPQVQRNVNALKWIAYWDIYKNYYANKQEELGAVIHNDLQQVAWTIGGAKWTGTPNGAVISVNNINAGAPINAYIGTQSKIEIIIVGVYTPIDSTLLTLSWGGAGGDAITKNFNELFENVVFSPSTNTLIFSGIYADTPFINGFATILGYALDMQIQMNGEPRVKTFPLSNIDDMRLQILQANINAPFVIDIGSPTPYNLALRMEQIATTPLPVYNFSIQSNQEGLALKTYQSDIYNNWLDNEWIDGTNGQGGINNITSISTLDGSISINEILMAKKIFDMLNRIAVSGGSYDDWLDATYTHERAKQVENPVYMGGLSKELIFQEVISSTATEFEPLGTLAGRGRMNGKNKGGYVKIKTDEPSYIMGIISLTPRIDYSQGNKWDSALKTMDDLHKPALDGIGFQDLMTENMAWWTARGATIGNYSSPSAGKQPAWVNYMTNVNKIRGNFAIKTQQMYMILNRKYEPKYNGNGTINIQDLTTYIDPKKFNNIFAETRLDAQNFWAQIKVDITARRKMSAKVIPNL